MSDDILRYEVIAVAMAEYPDTTCAKVTLGTNDEPDEARQAELRKAITDLYRKSFGEEPSRVAVAVLPWEEPDAPALPSRRGVG